MKKVLMAAALIGGTFFSANAEVNSFEDFGCVTSREIIKVTITWDHNGDQHTEYEYGWVTRCTSSQVTEIAIKQIQ